jgi:hypothetical protein
MKLYIFALLSFALMFSGCKKEEPMKNPSQERVNPKAYDVKCRKVIDIFSKLQPNIILNGLKDTFEDSTWIETALVQKIDSQKGKWYVHIEEGKTVFRIYPYLNEFSEDDIVDYWCIVLKLNQPGVSKASFISTFNGLVSRELKILEFALHGPKMKSIHKK